MFELTCSTKYRRSHLLLFFQKSQPAFWMFLASSIGRTHERVSERWWTAGGQENMKPEKLRSLEISRDAPLRARNFP